MMDLKAPGMVMTQSTVNLSDLYSHLATARGFSPPRRFSGCGARRLRCRHVRHRGGPAGARRSLPDRVSCSMCSQVTPNRERTTSIFPRAPGPYPQVRWLDPLAPTPTTFSGGGTGALGNIMKSYNS